MLPVRGMSASKLQHHGIARVVETNDTEIRVALVELLGRRTQEGQKSILKSLDQIEVRLTSQGDLNHIEEWTGATHVVDLHHVQHVVGYAQRLTIPAEREERR